MTKQETKNLLNIIQEAIKEVGITHFLCTLEIEKQCNDRNIGKFPEKYLGHRHCFNQIPYIRNIKSLGKKESGFQLIEICEYKILEYYKK